MQSPFSLYPSHSFILFAHCRRRHDRCRATGGSIPNKIVLLRINLAPTFWLRVDANTHVSYAYICAVQTRRVLYPHNILYMCVYNKYSSHTWYHINMCMCVQLVCSVWLALSLSLSAFLLFSLSFTLCFCIVLGICWEYQISTHFHEYTCTAFNFIYVNFDLHHIHIAFFC